MQKCLVTFIVFILFPFFSVSASAIERVSLSSNGIQADSSSFHPDLSADGRFVAFDSDADNLVDVTAGFRNIFVHDRDTGKTKLVSMSSTGEKANNFSLFPSISANGRFIAFQSRADNLVLGDTNRSDDIFVHDIITGVTESFTADINIGPSVFSSKPSISDDGRFVAFVSLSNQYVDNDTGGISDVFVYDRENNNFERASVTNESKQADDYSGSPSISTDGRFVSFTSQALNLVSQVPKAARSIYVRDIKLSTTKIVSVSSSGESANGVSEESVISSNGRFVAFVSNASNLADNDTNGVDDVFLHDLVTGETVLVSQNENGDIGNKVSNQPSISANSRYLVFRSNANNLIQGDNNFKADIFAYDIQTRALAIVSIDNTGNQTDGHSFTPIINDDGQFIAYASQATNLVQTDTNNWDDIFVTKNPLATSDNNLVTIEVSLNNKVRETPAAAAQLLAGTKFRQSYKVTNTSNTRIYQVQVFENGNLVCNLYALNPGQTKQSCTTFQTVLQGDQQTQALVTAKVSGTAQILSNSTNAHYTGHVNPQTTIVVNQYIDNFLADSETNAVTLDNNQAEILFIVKNTGDIELYQAKTYHDPVSPVNSGWLQQCNIGSIKPGELRFCKRYITLTESGLNLAMGRVQAKNAFINAPAFINFANPTYFVVP